MYITVSECKSCDELLVLSLIYYLVDSRITEMISLLPTRTQAQLSVSVDWLTEMVHRLSDAYTRRQPLSKVDMNAIKRPVKVRSIILF